jgi:hypothetical protein
VGETFYSDPDDEIQVETVWIEDEEIIVVTIHAERIARWYHDGVDRAVMHIEAKPRDPKFLEG